MSLKRTGLHDKQHLAVKAVPVTGSVVVDGLVAGATYQFRVRSVTQAGRSDFGEVASLRC